MNKIIKNKFVYIFLLAIAITSCSEDYLNVNTDPNNPVSVSPDLVLPVAQRYTAYSISVDRRTNTLGNLLMQNWSQSDGYNWYLDEFGYLVTNSFYNTIWDYQYGNVLKQYNVLDVETANYEYYAAISKIMKSFHFQVLVDTYGDIPYFEALQRGVNPTPAFDDALVVYEDLIVQLDNAIALINAGSSNANVITPGTDDAMFSGDMNKWKQMANTVKLRILIRQSDMSGRTSYVASEFNKIANEGSGFITEDALFNPGYGAVEDQQNPFWDGYGQNTAGDFVNSYFATCATPFVLNTLTSLGDSRIDYIYEEPDGGHLGVEQGLNPYPLPVGTLGEENVSNLGTGVLKGADASSVIFLLAEAELLQAEAALKNAAYVSGDAQSHFNAGVEASFNYLGASGAGAYTSTGLNLADYAASTNKLEAIITQKWIATNSIDAIQSWFDYSRTGYPSNLPLSLMSSTADRPVRLFYPASETSANGANVPAQPNGFSDKIFWAN